MECWSNAFKTPILQYSNTPPLQSPGRSALRKADFYRFYRDARSAVTGLTSWLL